MGETTLEHRTVPRIRPEEIEKREQIIESARTYLGYRGGDAYPVLLLQALQELGIQPFDEESVSQYKEKALEARRKLDRRAYWQRGSIPSYSEKHHIPVRVLQTALQIQQKLGNRVCFEIEYLASDPFLIVCQINSAGHRVGGDLYVDVWDEKGFEELLFGVDSATVES